jgi:hypothetical protein
MVGTNASPGTFTAGSGFTKRIDDGTTAQLMTEDETQSSTGSIAATATSSQSADYHADAMATFQ